MADAALLFDPFTFARWMGYLATFVLIGSATFQLLLSFRLNRHHPAACSRLYLLSRRVATGATVFLIIAASLKLRGQLATLVDPGEPVSRDMVRALIRSEGWGRGWIWQTGAGLLGLMLLLIVRRRWITIPIALLVAFTAPLTGHATENHFGALAGVFLHGLHQLGGGVWLGTLSLIVGLGFGGTAHIDREERHRLIARLVQAYSPVALAGVSTAVAAGVILAYGYVGTLGALIGSSYGRTLLIKTGLLGATAALGAYNWKRVRPALGSPVASDRLLRSATIELVVGSLLLAATAVLVALAAPALG